MKVGRFGVRNRSSMKKPRVESSSVWHTDPLDPGLIRNQPRDRSDIFE
jgi:hypothetical protein